MLRKIRQHRAFSSSAVRVLEAMLDRIKVEDTNLIGWESLASLARKTGLSERTVDFTIQELREAGQLLRLRPTQFKDWLESIGHDLGFRFPEKAHRPALFSVLLVGLDSEAAERAKTTEVLATTERASERASEGAKTTDVICAGMAQTFAPGMAQRLRFPLPILERIEFERLRENRKRDGSSDPGEKIAEQTPATDPADGRAELLQLAASADPIVARLARAGLKRRGLTPPPAATDPAPEPSPPPAAIEASPEPATPLPIELTPNTSPPAKNLPTGFPGPSDRSPVPQSTDERAELVKLAASADPIAAKLARAGLKRLGLTLPLVAIEATPEPFPPPAALELTPIMPPVATIGPPARSGLDARSLVARLADGRGLASEPDQEPNRRIDPNSRIWESVLELPGASPARVDSLARALSQRFRDWGEITNLTFRKYLGLVQKREFPAELVAGLVQDACGLGVKKPGRHLSHALADEWQRGKKPTAG